jgi:LPS sulfotransferase NodH
MKPLTVGYMTEARCYYTLLTTPRREPATKFIIFGRGRSGSSLLVSLLDSHEQIHCDGELLKRRVLFPLNYIKCRTALSQHEVYGFKLLSYHMDVQRIRDPRHLVTTLHELGYKIIYLRRLNMLRHALSNIYARHRGAFHKKATDGEAADKKEMHVDLEQLNFWLQRSEEMSAIEERAIAGLPHIEVIYENDLLHSSCHQHTADRIASFLNIPAKKVDTAFRRITSDTLQDFVLNYEEVEQYIAQTKYESFLSV